MCTVPLKINSSSRLLIMTAWFTEPSPLYYQYFLLWYVRVLCEHPSITLHGAHLSRPWATWCPYRSSSLASPHTWSCRYLTAPTHHHRNMPDAHFFGNPNTDVFGDDLIGDDRNPLFTQWLWPHPWHHNLGERARGNDRSSFSGMVWNTSNTWFQGVWCHSICSAIMRRSPLSSLHCMD